MPEQDRLIGSYVHLARLPRADEALRMLKLIISAVKPIMRNHRWKVGELAEFYPDEDDLLGLNVNGGRQIFLRLRYHDDKTRLARFDQVLDTMLHELCHNDIGPHNAAFHALWDKLRDEHMTLTLGDSIGASLVSPHEGRRLGGSEFSPEAVAAGRERGLVLPGRRGAVGGGGGHLHGGSRTALTLEARRAEAERAGRRRRALEGCGANGLNEAQIRNIWETVRRNGFRTTAGEAVALALGDLMGEGRRPTRRRRRLSEDAAATRSGSGSGRRGVEWACPVCTLLNPTTQLYCDVCGTHV
ncbi:zinc ion binding protein [Beauveria brongniartii RCEF 3172]|uniref:Zinc ion binding protein n=1 Tax=Beauveria brongniartii RCEF 3172 TaxID=1081107 RepID=A0A166X2F6_9HYPO|nr:zinc ion binding protein [Beauveria brongniartii RCEF 3172]